LVLQLIDQANNLKKPFEILVYDDGSRDEIKDRNRVISGYSNVVYHELEKNVGRSAIRNRMAKDASYEYLLFIDADSKIVKTDYLELYLSKAKSKTVLCGGTAYQKEKPVNPGELLRWHYGSHREAVSAKERNSKKGFVITSNNFLISKSVFKSIQFREELNRYGHEDTLFGYDLFQNKVEILHVDNPVEHTGLEEASLFVDKTKMALDNLYRITNDLLSGDQVFVKQVHFLNKYDQIRKTVPMFIFRFFYSVGSKMIERNLVGARPSLFWFDFYKLTYYATLGNKKNIL